MKEGERRCAEIIGYPDPDILSIDGDDMIALEAIAYGSFTLAGSDQAYVTYSSDFDSGTNNSGGGILFERQDDKWALLRWYPGGQMDECVALPGGDVQKMLCLDGSIGQGVDVQIVRVKQVGEELFVVLRAEDVRETADPESIACGSAQGNKPVLLSIDHLTRSQDSGTLAEAVIAFATLDAVREVCAQKAFAKVKTSEDTVRFVLRDGKITATGSKAIFP